MHDADMKSKVHDVMLSNTIWLIIVLSLGAAFGTALIGRHAYSEAIPTADLHGYAWTETVGWISMNCANTSCVSSHYKVMVNEDGALTGYGWSENIGWVKFGGPLSGFPGSGGNAYLVGSEIFGWARACAGTKTTDPVAKTSDCSSMEDSEDGWDGWISLNCANTDTCDESDYRLTVRSDGWIGSDNNSKFAWGSDVVGWVDFSRVRTDPPGKTTASLSANPPEVPSGDKSLLTWSSTNADRCVGDIFDTGNAISGSVWSHVLTQETTFTVTCSKGTDSAQASATVTIRDDSCITPKQPYCDIDGKTLHWEDDMCIPYKKTCEYQCVDGACVGGIDGMSIKVNPSLVRKGEKTSVEWKAFGVTSCSVRGSNGDGWSSSWACSGLACEPQHTNQSSAIQSRVTYTLSCLIAGQTYNKQAIVNIVPEFQEK